MSEQEDRMEEGHNANIYALIVAAGKGSRFGAQIPKQYISLNQRTLLEHSVARLSSSDYIKACLIVIAADDDIAPSLDFAIPVTFTTGGQERWQSVKAGVQALIDFGAQEQDLVVIHDAARPAVPTKDINQVIEMAKRERYGAILATPVADTLKAQAAKAPLADQVDEVIYIDKTVDRQGLWQALTPQVFRLGALQQVLDYVEINNLDITDEASAFEALSFPVRLVRGSRQNIKLTYAEDLELIKAIVYAQSSIIDNDD